MVKYPWNPAAPAAWLMPVEPVTGLRAGEIDIVSGPVAWRMPVEPVTQATG